MLTLGDLVILLTVAVTALAQLLLSALISHEKHLIAAVLQVDDSRLQSERLHSSDGTLALHLTLREHRLHHSIGRVCHSVCHCLVVDVFGWRISPT